MALPGVTTVLRDRFFALSRTDAPPAVKVLAMATRNTAEFTADASGVAVANYDPYRPRTEEDVILAFGEGSGLHRVYLELIAGGAAQVVLVALPMGTTDAMISGSSSGTQGENVIDQAFAAAETVRPDIIVPWGRGGHPTDWQIPATPSDDLQIGFYADNTSAGSLTNNVAKKVADKCKDLTDRSHPCFAVMGVKPYIGTTTAATENITAANLATHLTLANLTDHNATPFGDNGAYLSVVASEVNLAGYPTNATDRNLAGKFGYSNGAGLYAAYVSQLDPWTATTGKRLFNVTGLRYNPTRTQQDALSGKGLVPVALDFNRIPTWIDGVSFGRATSDYGRLSTLRIVFGAIQGIRQVAERFIGEAATLQNRNGFETAITSVLRGMTQVGAITDSDFVVTYLPRENRATVDVTMRPVFELRNIDISIAVDL